MAIAQKAIDDVLTAWWPEMDPDKRTQFRMELSSRIETHAEREAEWKLRKMSDPPALMHRAIMAEDARDRVALRLKALAAENQAFLTQIKQYKLVSDQRNAMLHEIERITDCVNDENRYSTADAYLAIKALIKYRHRDALPPLPETTETELINAL